MRDILPAESSRWRRFVDTFARVVEGAGYGQVMSPLLEDLGVFQRIGDCHRGREQGDVRLRRQGG